MLVGNAHAHLIERKAKWPSIERDEVPSPRVLMSQLQGAKICLVDFKYVTPPKIFLFDLGFQW